MNTIERFTISFAVGIVLASCTHDGLAKHCAKTDWYHRAYDQAVLGKPLRDGGDLLLSCDKRGNSDRYNADSLRGTNDGKAIYCSPETVRSSASQGEKTDLAFCGTELRSVLELASAEGTRLFCQPEAGLAFATKGGKYIGQCTKAEEKLFLPKYKEGHRLYIHRELEKSEQYLAQLDSQLEGLKLEQINLKKKRIDPWFEYLVNENFRNKGVQRTTTGESDVIRNDRDSFERTDAEIIAKIDRIKTQQSQIRSQNKQLRSDL